MAAPEKNVIIAAAGPAYFDVVRGLVLSLRDREPPGAGYPIKVLDLGLTK